MLKRVCAVLVSLGAVAAGLSFAQQSEAAVRCDGHQQCQHKGARRAHKRARAARQRARAHRRDGARAVVYVCPMHPDIRERERGTCPKCLMDLVAEPSGPRGGGSKVKARGAEAGASASGGM